METRLIPRRHNKGGGGGGEGRGSIGPLLSAFDTIRQIDLIFRTYNKLSFYFQLIETTRCLIGFNDSHNHINDVINLISCRQL